MKNKRIVVLDVVGLTSEHLKNTEDTPHLASLVRNGRLHTMMPVFPAVTIPVQASLTTGTHPSEHGMVANGLYFRDHHHVAFWEQSASLVQGERLWERLKKRNPSHRTALLFLQNSLYADVEAVITPRPLHTDEGLVQWCYSKPVGFYEEICEATGEFNLMHFWGPMAGIESSRWIARAAVETMKRIQPHLMIVYLPHLDYGMQRMGPDHPAMAGEVRKVDEEVGRIVQGVHDLGFGEETLFVVCSEYAFSSVKSDIALNRILREEGFVQVRSIKGREYLDFELSTAFAMVDHQVAHIYVKTGHEQAVLGVLRSVDGIDHLLERTQQKAHRINHPRSGDIIAVSSRDRWFSYYWWEDRSREPDFATHVDIHRKPGYDPLELFVEPGTFKISQDTSLIRGSHGYIPSSEEDRVPFLLSGSGSEHIQVPHDMTVADVSKVIEDYLAD